VHVDVNECNRLISTTDSWFARSIANQTVVSLSDLALENGTEWLHVMCPQSLLRLSLVANLGLPCRLRHGDVYGRARSRLRVLVGSDHSDAMRAGSQTEFVGKLIVPANCFFDAIDPNLELHNSRGRVP